MAKTKCTSSKDYRGKERSKFDKSGTSCKIRSKGLRLRLDRFSDARYIPAAKILTWWRRWRKKPISGPFSHVQPIHSGTDIRNTIVEALAKRIQLFQSSKRLFRYYDRRCLPAANILTWWRRWNLSSNSQDNPAVSVSIIIGSSHNVRTNKTSHKIKYFKLSINNPAKNADNHAAQDSKQKTTTGKSSPDNNIRNKDNILFDEEATPDVTESPTNDMLISDVEPPDDIIYYVDTNVTNGQQRKAHYLKQLSINDNIACRKNLLLNEIIVTNQVYRATTNIKKKNSPGCQENEIVNDIKSPSVTAPLAVATSRNCRSAAQISLNKLEKVQFETTCNTKQFKDFITTVLINTSYDIHLPIIKTCAYNNRYTLKCGFDKDQDILYHGTMYHTSLTNAHFSIDVFNTLIASVYLLNYCYILEIMARFADYDTLYKSTMYRQSSISVR